MNNISILYGRLLSKVVNVLKNTFDSYNMYLNNVAKECLPTKVEENILITAIGGAYAGHTFEGLFARKAMLHGNSVYVLMCDGYLSHCESIQNMATFKRIRCAFCRAQQKDFVKAFGVNASMYSSYVTATDESEIYCYIKGFFDRPSDEHIYKDTNIDAVLYSALQRYYLVADPEICDDAVTRGFLHTILATLIVIDKHVQKFHPKYVLSSHGIYSTWGAVVEYCKAHGIYVITYGQNYNHCGIEFTYDDSYLTGTLNDTTNNWMNKDLTEKDLARVKRFLDERMGRVNDDTVAFDYNKNNKSHYNKTRLCELLGIDKGKKVIGLFPNIPWDGQVTGDSAVFPHFRDWLRTTVDYFAEHNEAVLVIRSHPAEVLTGSAAGRETTTTMLYEMYSELPSNVILLEPKHIVNSYTLGENSDFGIAYSTTLTLELTYLGIPVILCGCPPFRNKNIAFDISSKEDYLRLLTIGLQGELKVEEKHIEQLFKYLHYFFFMRTMPQTLVSVKDTTPQNYLITSEAELDADPVFDEMFHCIEEKRDMDFSRFYE